MKAAQHGGGAGGLVRRMAEQRKTLGAIMAEASRDQEASESKLSLVDLLAIGIGSTIGSGVFVLTGNALPIAGPSAVVAWLLAGLVCLFSSLAYMELSARLPTKGSCYVFSYHGLGELASVIGAVCLTMEYGISGSGVARSWSGQLFALTGNWWVMCYNGGAPGEPGCNGDDDFYFDPLAGAMTALCAVVVALGTDMGKLVINTFTAAKICTVLFLIIAGLSLWTGNMFQSAATFAPTGAAGIVSATSVLFFGFIGFDEVCCMASKAKDPAKTMPKALAGTLLGAAILSGTAQLALAAMVPWTESMTSIAFPQAFGQQGWQWAKWLVSVAELALLPLVVLLSILPQPELTAAMSEDGLLPSVFRKSTRGVYRRGTIIVGALLSILAACVPFSVLWDVISIGVLLSFNLTNASLVQVRYGNGGSISEPRINGLVWVMLGAACVAGFTMYYGLMQPLMAGDHLQWPMSIISFVTLAIAFAAALAVSRCEVKCDMRDPAIFKAFGVPFIPCLAMFFNFFLIAAIEPRNLLYFGVFLVFIVGLYVAYIVGKRGQGDCSAKSERNIDVPQVDLVDTPASEGESTSGSSARNT
mmetsp:Transcript_2158/g.6433  ORF Transcript_2158/g.6433 Transcript_2158/m.6433 type:complete len:587 (-) Transcript_2158:407-2167(-)